MDTTVYQLFDLEVIGFCWEDTVLSMDAALWPIKVTLFSPSTSSEFELGSMAENQLLIDEEQDKENSPALPSTPVSSDQLTPCVDGKSPNCNKTMFPIMNIEICLNNLC